MSVAAPLVAGKPGNLIDRARGALAAGKFAEARKLLDKLLARRPCEPAALHLAAITRLRLGCAAEAIPLLEEAVNAQPAVADYWCDLGTAYDAVGASAKSEAAYRASLCLDGQHALASYNLANVLRHAGGAQEALKLYTELLQRDPTHGKAWNNAGLALLDMARMAEARRCFEQALCIDPENTQALLNLGYMQKEAGEVHQAIATYRKALGIAPFYSDLHANLGTALAAIGQTAEGIAHLRRAIELKPDNPNAHAALIFTLDFADDATTADQQDARRAWYEQCIVPRHIPRLDSYRQPDPERKLRIGYVSADFRATSAAICFAPLILECDLEQFEIVCYSNSKQEDGLTDTLREAAHAYRVVADMNDGALAEQVVADGIDILVDLSGHMKGNRLGAFAYKSAPLQMTGWGYANGSGMPEMDALFVDRVYLPPDDARHFAERPAYVSSVIPYRPFDVPPAVAELPAAARGYVTFGCFSRSSKITDYAIALWAKVLKALPTSRLVIKTSQRADGNLFEELKAKFTLLDVAPEHIHFLPNTPWQAHMGAFAEVDILLDPYPHGGGISLVDGLMMGVPTITLAGATAPARLGAGLLTAVGLTDWIAKTPAEFVAVAAAKANDVAALGKLRARLRAQLMASPIGDNGRYVREVEAHYRAFWRDSCVALQADRERRLTAAREALAKSGGESVDALLAPLLAADEQDADALHLAALGEFRSGRFDASIALLQRALAASPGRVDFWIDLGTVLTEAMRYGQAIDALDHAVGLAPDSALAHFNLGCVLLKADNTARALTICENAFRLAADDAKIVNNYGIALERAADVAQARAMYESACQLAPSFAQPHENMARLMLEEGRPEEALAHFERALERDTSLHHLRYELVIWYDKLGHQDKLSALSTLDFKTGRSAHKGKGHKRAPQVDAAQALATISRMVKADLERQGKSARALVTELLNFGSRMREVDHPGKLWLHEEAVRLDADFLHSYLRLGLCHYHDGKFKTAAAVWAEGLRRREALAKQVGLADCPHRILDSTWNLAVGHTALLDTYFKSMALGWRPKKEVWLTEVPGSKVPNRSYLEYFRENLHLVPPDNAGSNVLALAEQTGVPLPQLSFVTDHFFADYLPNVLPDKPGKDQFLWHQETAAAVQRAWEAEGRAPLLKLSDEHLTLGRETLRRLGVPDGVWYVCLHVRELGYWWKWNRHHPSIREAVIDTYDAVIRDITARGGWVIRLGDSSMSKLPPMAQVVDYAHSAHKSQAMDVFLCGSGRFFIGVNSGLSLVPPTFGVPCVLSNFTPISVPFPYGTDLMVPKLFRWKEGSPMSGELLSFEEMFKLGPADAQFTKLIPEGVEVVDNSPEELLEGVREMFDQLEGKMTAAEAAVTTELRSRYEALVLRYGGFVGTPLSGRFLQRHQTLL